MFASFMHGWQVWEQWLQTNEHLVFWVGGISTGLFLGVTFATVYLILQLPSDFFVERMRAQSTPKSRVAVLVYWLRNLGALVLLVAGLLMLLLPGPGMMTLLAAVVVMEHRRKRELERWLLMHGRVMDSINWWRRMFNRPPMLPLQHD